MLLFPDLARLELHSKFRCVVLPRDLLRTSVAQIEDTREINLAHDNWIPAVARVGFGIPNLLGKQYGEITLFDLLRETFRQNPDYVVVGEVRGKETYVLFQGMASGHSSISTLHADSVDTVVKRLETPPIELSPTLLNVLDCVCVMTHAIVKKQETRKLKEVVEVVNVNKEGIDDLIKKCD